MPLEPNGLAPVRSTAVLGALCRLGVPDVMDPSGGVFHPVGEIAAKVSAPHCIRHSSTPTPFNRHTSIQLCKEEGSHWL
jgi:hypothetical protein